MAEEEEEDEEEEEEESVCYVMLLSRTVERTEVLRA